MTEQNAKVLEIITIESENKLWAVWCKDQYEGNTLSLDEIGEIVASPLFQSILDACIREIIERSMKLKECEQALQNWHESEEQNELTAPN